MSDAGQLDDAAIEQLRLAAAIYRDLDGRVETARTLQQLGDALRATGRHHQAREARREALAIFEELKAPQATDLRALLARGNDLE